MLELLIAFLSTQLIYTNCWIFFERFYYASSLSIIRNRIIKLILCFILAERQFPSEHIFVKTMLLQKEKGRTFSNNKRKIGRYIPFGRKSLSHIST